MKNFLKRFSKVPNDFIDDFFSIASEKYDSKEIVIDLDIVALWLDSTKGNLKRFLVQDFYKNYDYRIDNKKIKINNKNNHGANYIEKIYVSADCFKGLCMLSRSKKAREVRGYYLIIEALLSEYHKDIENNLYRKLNMLEYNQKPKINIKSGLIYFFKALNYIKLSNLEEELYKLGKTKNVKKRFVNYGSGTVNDIEPLFILEVDDIDKVEKCIKNLLTEYQYRKRKEIYQINLNALKTVFVNCSTLVKGFERYMDKIHPKTTDRQIKKMKSADKGLVLYFKKHNNMSKKTKNNLSKIK